MGIQERKERQRKELREKIIQAATQLFLEHGYQETSIRMIAQHIEYSPTTIYLHFQDKDELFYEIMDRAFALFFNYLSQKTHIKDPLERLKAMNYAYMDFALEQSAYYDLMFVIKDPMRHQKDSEGWEMGMRSHQFLTQTIQDCMEAGHFQGQNPEALAITIWAAIHGIVTLHLRDRMNMFDLPKQKELMVGAVKAFHHMM